MIDHFIANHTLHDRWPEAHLLLTQRVGVGWFSGSPAAGAELAFLREFAGPDADSATVPSLEDVGRDEDFYRWIFLQVRFKDGSTKQVGHEPCQARGMLRESLRVEWAAKFSSLLSVRGADAQK